MRGTQQVVLVDMLRVRTLVQACEAAKMVTSSATSSVACVPRLARLAASSLGTDAEVLGDAGTARP